MNNGMYGGTNLYIKAHPGIKMLAMFLQFGGQSRMIDTLFILSAFELGLPESEEEATRQAMEFNAGSDRRYLGEI